MVQDLLHGHGRFRAEYAADERAYLERLAVEGQRPGAMFVGCSDSRVVPELLTGAEPGQLFVVRNVANVVPPSGGQAVSVGAALEFAVGHLRVANLIVCGHDRCGGIEALIDGISLVGEPSLADWLEPARAPVERARASGLDREAQVRRAVEESVLEQLANALSYPVVRAARAAGRLDLHGWVYDVHALELRVFEAGRDSFVAAGSIT